MIQHTETKCFLRWLTAGLMLCWLGLSSAVMAAEAGDVQKQVVEAAKKLDGIETDLARKNLTESELRDWLGSLTVQHTVAQTCVTTQEAQLNSLTEALASLGEASKVEPPEVRSKRRDLERDKIAVDKQLAQCRLLLLRSGELHDTVNAQLKEVLARRLLAKGPNLLLVIMDHLHDLPGWGRQLQDFLLQGSGFEFLNNTDRVILALLLITGIASGIGVRRRIRKGIELRPDQATTFSEHFLTACVATFGHFAPHLLSTLLAAGYLFYRTGDESPVPFLNVLAYGLPIYYFLLASMLVFLAPKRPGKQLFDLDPKLMRALGRRLRILLALAFIIYLFITALVVQRLPDAALYSARGLIVGLFALNLIWVVWLLGRFPGLAGTLWLRIVAYLLLFGVVVADWLGYRNLALSGFRGVVGSMVAFGLLALFSTLLGEFFDNLDAARKPRHQRIRELLGVIPGRAITGLVWVRLISTIALWSLFAMALLRAWDLSDATTQGLQERLSQGLQIGSLHIEPMRFLLALLVTALLLALSGWFRSRLDRRWLMKTRMDRGAREAMVTITGYAGTAVAVLIGLGITGMDFSNLAIIFGALSVGIGFGLQNIVNNFVSGLILLFERPVKTGDWVVVGNTEGYVKRIRIRSTQIQTFDRADVIVPNSDLISNQVTNWMLYDMTGRLRLPIGVAYGSDTQLVKEILLRLADEHPSVLTDGSVPAPKVLFLGFGDSSLNFELRAHVRNIDERLQVVSDLNFALDAAFREQGIEIPFPQRDLHVRSYPPLAPGPSPETGRDA